MNVSSISSLSANELWELLQSGKTQPSNSHSGKSASSADASKLSTPGQLFKELESLSKSNPAEFKKITSKIAQQLQNAATSSTDPSQANFLSQMAANFSNASQTGNFSDLFAHSATASAGTEGSATAVPAGPQTPYAVANGATVAGATSTTGAEAISTIFSQALAQIQTDLSGSTSTPSS